MDLIRSNKEHAGGALAEYLSTFSQNLEKFRISCEKKDEDTFDEKVIANIDSFLPYRNELITLIVTIARYRNTPDSIEQIHRFFESLIPYMSMPENITQSYAWDYDNFKFIIHE